MVIRNNPEIPRYKNKHLWKYKFSYENAYWGKSFYEIETKNGFQIAEYYADNNMRWDAATNLQYLGKERIK